MGKGCKRRPTAVDDKELDDRWEIAFKRTKKNPERMKPKRKPKNED
jgi:hypothetical protein